MTYQPHSAISVAPDVDREALDLSWPLVGLLLQERGGDDTIDLASPPHRAPDLSARRRQRLLVGAGALVLTSLLGWTIGNKARHNFEAEVEDLKEKATGAIPEHLRFKRDTLRLQHLATWESVDPEWLEHLRFFHGFARIQTAVVLESWSTRPRGLRCADYDRKEKEKSKRWSVLKDVKIAVEGEAKDRGVADALRDSLVDDARYALTSTGADTQGGHQLPCSPFAYVLRSADPRSPSERAKPADKGAREQERQRSEGRGFAMKRFRRLPLPRGPRGASSSGRRGPAASSPRLPSGT